MHALALLVMAGLAAVGVADAAVYRCVDPQTKVTTYSGTPCPSGESKVLTIDSAPRAPDPVDAVPVPGQPFRASPPANAAPKKSAPTLSAAQQDEARRLSGECARGMSASCDTLRKLGGGSVPQTAVDPADKARLADECGRGIQDSCRTLDILGNRVPAPASNDPRQDRLAAECARGFKQSCAALGSVR